jgi:hypothetical protein
VAVVSVIAATTASIAASVSAPVGGTIPPPVTIVVTPRRRTAAVSGAFISATTVVPVPIPGRSVASAITVLTIRPVPIRPPVVASVPTITTAVRSVAAVITSAVLVAIIPVRITADAISPTRRSLLGTTIFRTASNVCILRTGCGVPCRLAILHITGGSCTDGLHRCCFLLHLPIAVRIVL